MNVRADVKVAADDLKVAVGAGDPGQVSLKIGYYEEVLFQYETQAHLLYEQVREINRCYIRSGKYLLWVSIEEVTQTWTKTYIKVIKTTVTWFKKIYKVKLLGIVNTSTVGCCECNGVARSSDHQLRQRPGLTAAQCNIACLPFASNGELALQQMCDAATGTCVPDP